MARSPWTVPRVPRQRRPISVSALYLICALQGFELLQALILFHLGTIPLHPSFNTGELVHRRRMGPQPLSESLEVPF